MIKSPDAVYIIIPAMKELGMSWNEIKNTPRHEITGLVGALNQYEILHSYDGYTDEDINQMAKDKPAIRSSYNKYLTTKADYQQRSGNKRQTKSFKDLVK